MSLSRYESYKNWENSVLSIPSHWSVLRLHRLASINDDTLPEDCDPSREVEYVDIGSVTLGRGIHQTQQFTFSSAPSRARRLVRYGDIIVSTVRTYLKAIAPIGQGQDHLVVSTGFAVVRPKSVLVTGFAKYALQSPIFVDEVISRSTGVSYPAINASDLARIDVPTPPPEEQVAITTFLDRETAKIDALIAEQERLLELLAEKRQAVISHAVTKGLNPDVPMKDSGVAWLGAVPVHWTIEPLANRYSVQLGKMLDSARITGVNLRPYLRVFDVQWGQINVTDLPQMDFDQDERVKFRLEPGDILVNEGGSYPGRSAIWRGQLDECFYQKALHRLRPHNSEIDTSEFFYFVLDWAANGGVFSQGGNETTIEHLPAEKLRRYRFAFPPREEQCRIAEFLVASISKLDALADSARLAIDLLKARRATLIFMAVTGKIDVRGAA